MRRIAKNITLKCFLLLMALQVLNLGIDAIDFQPLPSATAGIEDFNYINSMAEYVSEIVLGHKDAFPEFQKESSSSQSQFTKHFSITLYQLYTDMVIIKTFDNNHTHNTRLIDSYNYLFFKEINPPPPKA
jgi:hypothetical protein